MGRIFTVDYDHIPVHNFIRCRMCRTRVALTEDYIATGQNFFSGILTKVFNVEIPENEIYHLPANGYTLAYTYCVQCRVHLGGKVINVTQPSMCIKEGRFVMKLDELIYWNDVTLFNLTQQLARSANAQAPNDQVGGANGQAPNGHVGGANEQNADQNGYANEQNADQNGDANEQNADQNGGANEQNVDQNGGVPMN